jgi:hypothetical protein
MTTTRRQKEMKESQKMPKAEQQVSIGFDFSLILILKMMFFRTKTTLCRMRTPYVPAKIN